jgi:hypothetical protein
MDVTERLNAIRMRFVGTGEDHELLSRLAKGYTDGYDAGAKARETKFAALTYEGKPDGKNDDHGE